jgi:hypothetical protein
MRRGLSWALLAFETSLEWSLLALLCVRLLFDVPVSRRWSASMVLRADTDSVRLLAVMLTSGGDFWGITMRTPSVSRSLFRYASFLAADHSFAWAIIQAVSGQQAFTS